MKPLLYHRYLSLYLVLVGFTSLLSGCLFKLGDTNSVKKASELAIDCKTEEALTVVDQASHGGGLSASIADLLRVAILRDVNRNAEADAALVERNQRWEVAAKDLAETEKSIAKTVTEIRAERQKRTGHLTCD